MIVAFIILIVAQVSLIILKAKKVVKMGWGLVLIPAYLMTLGGIAIALIAIIFKGAFDHF